MSGPGQGAPAHARRLGLRRAQARLALWFEALWPALWPAVGTIGLYVALALLGLPPILPLALQWLLLGGFALAALALLWRGLSRMEHPDSGSADRRLETASGLAHRPLALLADRPALADEAGQVLWRAHVARAAASLGRLRVGAPRPGLARRDRRALRGGLVVALVAAFGIAGPDAGPRLLAAFSPTLPAGAAPPATQIEAWITPPAYTGVPPLFLKPEGGGVAVPAGSQLTVSLTGGTGAPALALDGISQNFRVLAQGSWQAERTIATGGRLVVRRRGRQVAGWDVTAIADRPPVIAWSAAPGASSRDQMTRLPWKADDDYGVASLQAELRLKERPDIPPLTVAIPLAGTPKSARGIAVHDLTANPWAGLAVTARLIGKDAPGQRGMSAQAEFTLPERRFLNPVARALIAVRKQLTLHPEDRTAAIAELARVASDPGAFDNDDSVFLNLSAVISLLARDREAEAVPQTQDRLWELALQLEEASPARTARALADARARLEDALRQAQQGNPDKQAIDRRIQALQQAIQQHLQALLQQAQREGKTLPPLDPNAPAMTDRDLQRMLDRMRSAVQQGRMQDAQQQMAQLEQMLQALEHARPAQPQDAQNNAKRQRGQQQMGALQDMLQREGGVLDHTQERASSNAQRPGPLPLPGQFPSNGPNLGGLSHGGSPPGDRAQGGPPPGDQVQGQGQPGQGQNGQGQNGQEQNGQAQNGQDQTGQDQIGQSGQGQGGRGQPGRRDARVQNALRRALGELMQQFGDLTGKVPGSLGEADQAMQQAVQALGQGQDSQAAAAEQKAIDALQKGGQQMGQQMATQFGLSMRPGQGQQGQGQDSGQDGDQDGQGDAAGNADGGDRDGNYAGTGSFGKQDGPRDPLGRLTGEGTSGSDQGDDVRIPNKTEAQRSREIQDELRRREGQRTRPQEELDYIGRLLKSY